MDFAGLAAVITALSVLITAVAKVWLDLRAVRSQQKTMWRGIVARGYVEAEKIGVLVRTGDPARPWTVSEQGRLVYETIKPTLKATRAKLREKLGREPADDTLAWAFEREFQQWFLEHACRELGVDQHGCLAVACVIAKENGS